MGKNRVGWANRERVARRTYAIAWDVARKAFRLPSEDAEDIAQDVVLSALARANPHFSQAHFEAR